MNMITIILIYLLGCVLAYGRIYACLYEIGDIFTDEDFRFTIGYSLLSWITFISGIVIYFSEDERDFIRFW